VACQSMKANIYAYQQRNLEEAKIILVEEHLRECAECRAELLKWQELEECFAALEVKPPRDFTSQVMRAIKNRTSTKKEYKNFWFAGWYRNVGRGLIAAGILGIFINCSALAANIPLEKSFDKAFTIVEEIGDRYLEFYEQVSLNDIIRRGQGGINNEM
jgi:anti-sigma factor RsiW